MGNTVSVTAIPQHSGLALSDSTPAAAAVALPADAAGFEQLLMATLSQEPAASGAPLERGALLALLTRCQLKGEYPHPYQDSLLALLKAEAGAAPEPRESNIVRFLDGVFRILLRECQLEPTLLA